MLHCQLIKKVFKNDSYKKARGGYSRDLEISCESCKAFIGNYQKDGPGLLKRMYLDRISNSVYSGQEYLPESSIKPFVCVSCNKTLGTLMNYEKENRLAYRLFMGAVGKKISKKV